MTGYTVHTGTSKKFVSGWDRVFSGNKADTKAGGTSEKKPATSSKKKKKK